MNMKKILAAATASVLTVGAMSVVASADPLLKTVISGESGKPTDAAWEPDLTLVGDENLAKVDTIVATVTGQAYFNGAMGGNTVSASGWAPSDQQEGAAGTQEWKWENIGGLLGGKNESGDFQGYFKVEVWWQNVGEDGSDTTVTVDKVTFLDKDGATLYTYEGKAADSTESTSSDATGSDAASDTTSGDKAPVPTGVGGVAAVFGVVAVAAGAMVVAKKRK